MSGPDHTRTPSADGPPVRPRDDIALMAGYHSPQVDVDVRLNTNEAPEPPPPGFTTRLHDALADIAWHRYPDRSYRELRAALADQHNVRPEQVFVANGSNEVLQSLCLAYGGPGRRAVVFEPTYAMHSHIAKVAGTDVQVGERAPSLALDPDLARQLLADTRPDITFLCSPNNPTGMVEPADIIASLVDAAPGLVVVDEAYGEFSPTSALMLVSEQRPLVVTRTYSKTWAMAGVRLGYLIGPSWLVAELDKVVLPYHLDAMKQAAGTVALAFSDEMEARVARLVEERGRLMARLAELPVDIWPSGANFVLFRPRERDGDAVWQDLLDRSVLVRNCSSWPGLDGCLRVTIGTRDEDDAFLTALDGALDPARDKAPKENTHEHVR